MGEYDEVKDALIVELAKFITTNVGVKKSRLEDGNSDAVEWDRICKIVGCGENPVYNVVVFRVRAIING